MKEELSDALKRDFPTLFPENFWFECGDGWEPLIRELANKLPVDVVATQVKEKFGGLRFYIESGDDETYRLIDATEARSLTMCEQCGEPGSQVGKYWVKTLCRECDARKSVM